MVEKIRAPVESRGSSRMQSIGTGWIVDSVSCSSRQVRLTSRMIWHVSRGASAVLFVAMAGCTGMIGDGPGPGGGSSPSSDPAHKPGDPPVVGTTKGLDGAGPYPLARLTRAEYANTLRDLSGGQVKVAVDELPADAKGTSGFTSDVTLSQVEVDELLGVAMTSAAGVTTYLRSQFICDGSGGREDTCSADYVKRAGQLVYRRPLDEKEAAALTAQYETARTTLGATHDDALRIVTETMLMSPSFLYRWELGYEKPLLEGNLVRFNDYEVSARLSYFLWKSMPDAELLRAAGARELRSAEQIAAQATRMLLDAKAGDTIDTFFSQWAGIANIAKAQKDPVKFPAFTAQLAHDLGEETRQFVRHVLFEGDGTLTTLLNADYTYVNERVAKLYGISGVTGEAFVKVSLPAERAGLFTQGSFLASTGLPNGTSPPRRAKAIVDHVACIPISPPPANLMITVPPPEDGKTTREIFEEHATSPQCRGCHASLDPIGFAFEAFDAAGGHRTQEAGQSVDSSGQLAGIGSFKDAGELMRLLAGRDDVGACSTRSWFRYMLNRIETEEEQSSLDAAGASFKASTFDIKRLLVSITTTKSFLYRTRLQGEPL
jgi:Protein of unknown function (DUF1592)/Protein of unknown function (DUF1588)/Protein of unknown function (DUF1595)/Protein of unknown function (DUF1585)/Protein of unknown function (DUF1587)